MKRRKQTKIRIKNKRFLKRIKVLLKFNRNRIKIKRNPQLKMMLKVKKRI
jgi:hypothetical protein